MKLYKSVLFSSSSRRHLTIVQYEPESDSDQDSDEEDSDGELPGMRRRRRIVDSDDESVDSDGEPRRKGKKRQRFDEEGNEIEDVRSSGAHLGPS